MVEVIISRLLNSGASQATLSDMMKQMSAESKGIPSTQKANQSENDEEIVSVNLFLLSR